VLTPEEQVKRDQELEQKRLAEEKKKRIKKMLMFF